MPTEPSPSSPSTAPTASGEIEIDAPAERVYALVSDPGVLAELAGEYAGHRWLGGATAARPGARFRGRNRNGLRRWSTVATITEAEEGRRFAFDVTFGPIPVSRWQYDLEPSGDGCRVREVTWNRSPRWFRVLTSPFVGVRPDGRDERNQRNIAATLERLKARAER
ncbi:SRPBCC family protein [Prauserella muralis]|uniref:Polyketide cyclase n=1 Tax=Prauserella muralis TaxID=588067 RepID=A0A2V4B871_9PSEU|nr:SRPBCC family protein [Prauserella muralis]PXY31554.1 polyketide cyclase [Prauserella muralis]TWE14094.1 polyketide cyclase/dehydrase/lipid transport protein [Prauserella muralis]